MSNNYFINSAYNARIAATQDFDGEARMTDGWQDEVYAAARQLADDRHLSTVLDIGTGSGFKLLKYFKDKPTLGIDLEPAVTKLKKMHPDRAWMTVYPGEASITTSGVDLVICSDVIEHVDDPDALCGLINSVGAKYAVISTPDRELVCQHHGQPPLGPPRNTTHVREWSYAEFGQYMAQHFTVEKQFYSNFEQYTMCVVARLK